MAVPEFIQRLRAALGSDHLLWLSGVTAVVVDEQERILLQRCADTGAWRLLSGILEVGEQPADGVVREVAEETGVHVQVHRLAAVTVTEERTLGNGDRVQFLVHTFLCTPVAGEARVNDDESLEVRWFAPSELPDLSPSCQIKLRHALSGGAEAWFQPSVGAEGIARGPAASGQGM
ncbi:NUDIX hydrolase [Streptomyces sp. NPDC021100]|uniref:NUDIX hydrolase n=1 Tax=Streptomyces sp. NPDC021100 TaxID=3365114 RepID=UPI00379272C2